MADPDDDALTWSGDDLLQAPPRDPAERPTAPRRPRRAGRSSGGASLVALGVLAGVAVLETLLWIRGLLDPAIAASVTTGSGSAAALAAFAANAAGRVLAAAAPLVWFGLVAWQVRSPAKRLAWMLLGAVLLVPWPFLLRLA